MALRVDEALNWFEKHRGKWAVLGCAWFLYSLAVTYNFIIKVDTTVTLDNWDAFFEGGTVACLVGNDLLTFCLTARFLSLMFFEVEVIATPKRIGMQRLREEIAHNLPEDDGRGVGITPVPQVTTV